jgi:hypothetical protein
VLKFKNKFGSLRVNFFTKYDQCNGIDEDAISGKCMIHGCAVKYRVIKKTVCT